MTNKTAIVKWKVKGCHLIRVNHKHSIPGNAAGVVLDKKTIDACTIEFIGTGHSISRVVRTVVLAKPLRKGFHLCVSTEEFKMKSFSLAIQNKPVKPRVLFRLKQEKWHLRLSANSLSLTAGQNFTLQLPPFNTI